MVSRIAVGGLSVALGLVLSAASSADEPKTGPARRLAEIFQDLDVDRDGALSASEVDAAAKPAFKTILKEGDANKDGKIDSKEFDALGEKLAAARKGANNPKGKRQAKPVDGKPADSEKSADGKGGDRLKQLVERFQSQDADKDGRLSRAEFQGKPAMFDRLDANGDGYVDKTDIQTLKDKRKAAGEKAGKRGDKAKPADKS